MRKKTSELRVLGICSNAPELCVQALSSSPSTLHGPALVLVTAERGCCQGYSTVWYPHPPSFRAFPRPGDVCLWWEDPVFCPLHLTLSFSEAFKPQAQPTAKEFHIKKKKKKKKTLPKRDPRHAPHQGRDLTSIIGRNQVSSLHVSTVVPFIQVWHCFPSCLYNRSTGQGPVSDLVLSALPGTLQTA